MQKSHKVVAGETLSGIAVNYFGLASKWTAISNANPQLATRPKASDGSPIIYPGDNLIIPADMSLPDSINGFVPEILDYSKKADVSLYVDGRVFTGFSAFRLKLSATQLDTFSFTAPFDEGVKAFKAAFTPFNYKLCSVYYDKKIVFCGRLLLPVPSVSPDSKVLNLQGYPLCGVLGDCCLPATKYPPEYSGMKLLEIAQDMAEPFGVEVELDGDQGEAFELVEYDPEKKILEFLSELAKQRGLVFTNTPEGKLLFIAPQIKKCEAIFQEGELPFVKCVPNFNSQDFYSHVTGFTKTEFEEDSSSFTFENQYLISRGILRPYSFVVQDADSVNLEDAVKAKAARMYGSSISYTLTVMGHRDKNGNLYHKNMCISVYSPDAMINRPIKLIADEVELTRDDQNGQQTVFKLVLPGARSGQLPEEFPWEG